MPCSTVHPKQRVMGADVPGFYGLRTRVAAGLSPAAPPRDPIVEHAATLLRERHAVKPKFLGFYRLEKDCSRNALPVNIQTPAET